MLLITADSDFKQEALNTHKKIPRGTWSCSHGLRSRPFKPGQGKRSENSKHGTILLMHSSQPERDDARENLAYACSSNGVPLTGEAATKMWYIPHSQLYFFAQIINATDC